MADEQQQLPEGVIAIPNVPLEPFEKVCLVRDFETANRMLVENLRRLKAGAGFLGYPRDDDRVQRILMTRFITSALGLLLDPRCTLSRAGFDYIAAEHAVIDLGVRYSFLETSDHLLAVIADNPEELDRSKLKLSDTNSLCKFLLAYSLRSAYTLDFDKAFRGNPDSLFNLWAGMISPLLTIASTAHERREQLLGMFPIFNEVQISPSVMITLGDAYMYTSYGTRRDKHEAKKFIHRKFAEWMRNPENRVPLPPAEQINTRRQRCMSKVAKGDAKPKLLIPIDWFTKLHSMYRCYAPVIRQLKSKFYLIGMGRATDTDTTGREEFDEWHFLPENGMNLAANVAAINKIAPDMIYYPSVGMAMWWIAAASVRLAPVQVMTLGHPASSFSQCMDYLLCDEGAFGDPALAGETVIEYKHGAGRYLTRPDTPDLKKLIAEADAIEPNGEMHVAVPAMLCKLNEPFMRACQEIGKAVEAQGRKVTFHFWVNMLGLTLQQAAHEIREWLPNSLIYERRPYEQYMLELSRCHLHLSCFPFGGTNSNIDSMMVGVPIVTRWGDEPHERFDGMMLRRIGLESDLVAHSAEDYVAGAVRILTDDVLRAELRQRILAADLVAEFFDPPPPELEGEFVNAMWGAFMRGPRKVTKP